MDLPFQHAAWTGLAGESESAAQEFRDDFALHDRAVDLRCLVSESEMGRKRRATHDSCDVGGCCATVPD